MSRLARVGVHRHPPAGPAIDRTLDAGPGPLGGGRAGRQEGRAHRLLAPPVPHAGHPLRRVAARGLLRRQHRDHQQRDGGEHSQRGQRDAGPQAGTARIAAKLGQQRLHRPMAPARFGRHAAREHAADVGGDVVCERQVAWVAGGRRPELVGQRARLRVGGVDLVRPLAAQRLVQRDAEAVLIGAAVHRRPPLALLRGHVGRRAHRPAGGGEGAQLAVARAMGRRADGLVVSRLIAVGAVGSFGAVDLHGGEPEVGHPHAAGVVDEDVVRLEVAVHDAGGVGGGQTLAGALEHVHHLAPRACAPRQPGPQGAPGHQLHGQEDLVGVGADVVDGDHVRVRQLPQGLRLAQEPPAGRLAPRIADQLERHLAIEIAIVGRIDHAHGAGAEPLDDDIAADRGPAGRQILIRRSAGRRALRGDGRSGRSVDTLGHADTTQNGLRLRTLAGDAARESACGGFRWRDGASAGLAAARAQEGEELAPRAGAVGAVALGRALGQLAPAR